MNKEFEELFSLLEELQKNIHEKETYPWNKSIMTFSVLEKKIKKELEYMNQQSKWNADKVNESLMKIYLDLSSYTSTIYSLHDNMANIILNLDKNSSEK